MLEADQVWPADGQAGRQDTLALHAAAPVHQVGNADQDFLGVAPAQLAGSSEGVIIDDGHAPPGLTAGIGWPLGGNARSQANHINAFCPHRRASFFFPMVPAPRRRGTLPLTNNPPPPRPSFPTLQL